MSLLPINANPEGMKALHRISVLQTAVERGNEERERGRESVEEWIWMRWGIKVLSFWIPVSGSQGPVSLLRACFFFSR